MMRMDESEGPLELVRQHAARIEAKHPDGSALVAAPAEVSDDARVYGSAWVFEESRVTGHSWVYGAARVYGSGDLATVRHLLTIGPVGSDGRTVTVHRHYDGPDSTKWGHLVVAGYWTGTAVDLAVRIAPSGDHGWDGGDDERWRADYRSVIALAAARAAEWAAEPLTAADHARWAGTPTVPVAS